MDGTMKIVYIAFTIYNKETNGVYNKILGQQTSFIEKGNSCDVLLVNKKAALLIDMYNCETIYYFDNENDYKQKISAIVSKYDMAYMRQMLGMQRFHQCLSILKKENAKVALEFPTYPVHTEILGKAKYWLKQKRFFRSIRSLVGSLCLRFVFLPLAIKKVDVIVLISSEDKFRNKKTVRIENGINTRNMYKKELRICDGKIHFIAVANVSYWHGFDRVIFGLKEYVERTGKRDVTLTIVGDGDYSNELHRMVEEFCLSDIVLFAGECYGENLNKLFDQNDIAIGSLGLHRQKLIGASTLKCREYFCRGIPCVVSKNEMISKSMSSYAYIVVGDDTPIQIESIRKWYMNIQNIHAHSENMHTYACENFGWNIQMEKVCDAILSESRRIK